MPPVPLLQTHDLIEMQAVASEVARQAGVLPPPNSYNRLKGAAYDGRLETVKIGGRRYMPRSELPRAFEILGLSSNSGELVAA
jgi:hypothetical protein